MSFERLEHIHKYGLSVNTREIYLIGEDTLSNMDSYDEPGVEYVMSNRFIKNFNYLQSLEEEPIWIHLKSCGGVWEEGMAIYDLIKESKCFVTILSYTHARSMSSLILQAGDRRIMMPSSYFLYHMGTIELSGEVKTVFSSIERSKYDNETMLNIYIDSVQKYSKIFKNKDRKYIRKQLISQMDRKGDVYLTPQEAINFGFADEIFNKETFKIKTRRKRK